MLHSERIAWLELAYQKIREELIPEAPAHITLVVGYPTKKRQGQDLCVGECTFDVMDKHEAGFGAENIITIHPILGGDVVLMLAALAREMIHHALEPDVRNKKPFQAIAKRIGLCKPWTTVQPDGTLQQSLRGIALEVEKELGYMPVGVYQPPKPKEVEKKPSQSVKLRCRCAVPRTLTLTKKQLELGSIMCGKCKKAFIPMTEATPEAAKVRAEASD